MTVAARPRHKLHSFPTETLQMFVRLPPARQSLLYEYPDPDDLVVQLTELGLLTETTRLLACTLPEREAVWWGCMCVTHTAPPDSPPIEREALEAAEAWVRQPGAPGCYERALTTAQACNGAPPSWVGLAICWSQRLRKPNHGAARGVEAAISRAAVRTTPEHRAERLQRFIASGRDIATGGAGRLPPAAG